MKFACVLKSGGIYEPSHVQRLKSQLPKHIPLVCLSDLNFSFPGVCVLPLEHDLPGWWSKLELFSHLATENNTIYFDLDVEVLDDPTCFLFNEFRMCSDFVLGDRFNSSVMSWRKAPSWITTRFLNDSLGNIKRFSHWPDIGDQAYIEKNFVGITPFPKGFVRSYRLECSEEIPDGTKVIAFHGRPKPWELT